MRVSVRTRTTCAGMSDGVDDSAASGGVGRDAGRRRREPSAPRSGAAREPGRDEPRFSSRNHGDRAAAAHAAGPRGTDARHAAIPGSTVAPVTFENVLGIFEKMKNESLRQ